jgi:hypothetical protein
MPQPVRKTSRKAPLRGLLIDYRLHRLPKSPPPPKWSAPSGCPDPFLEALQAGEAVTVGSATLLSAFIAGGLPRSAYDRFCWGGSDHKTLFVLHEDDQLRPYVAWGDGFVPRPVDGLRRRLTANRQRFLARHPAAGGDERLEALQAKTPVAVPGWELRAAGVDCDDALYVLEPGDELRRFAWGVDDKAEQ